MALPPLRNLQGFFENNEALPEDVMQSLQTRLAQPRQKLADLEAELAYLLGRSKELEREREKIQKSLSKYKYLLAPIRRLPAEILYEIFKHCLPTRHNPIMSTRQAPLSLTHICSAWRQIALASPALWARIYITFSDGNPTFNPSEPFNEAENTAQLKNYISAVLRHRCAGIEEWLSRSGSYPLSISVLYTIARGNPRFFHSWRFDQPTVLLRNIARFSSRWQSLELRMPAPLIQRLGQMVQNSQLSMLTSVKIIEASHRDGTDIDVQQQPLFTTFVQAQNLTRISLSSLSSDLAVILSHPNIRNMTNFFITSEVSITQARSILQNSPNLEHVKLSLSFEFPPGLAHDIATQGDISLPRLRTLSINDPVDPEHTHNGIFECLDAPLLEWLDYTRNDDLSVIGNFGTSVQRPVIAFLKKSMNLKKLTVTTHESKLSPPELREMLGSTPSLTHLVFGPERRKLNDSLTSTLERDPDGRELRRTGPRWGLHSLFLQPENGEELSENLPGPIQTLVPLLEILEVSQLSSTHVTSESLLSFILHREKLATSGRGSYLKKVAVIFSREETIDVAQELSAYSETAAKIELQLEYPDRNLARRLPKCVRPEYGTDGDKDLEEMMTDL